MKGKGYTQEQIKTMYKGMQNDAEDPQD